MTTARSEFFKKTLRWLPGVLISAIAIYAVLRFSHVQEIGQALRTVKISFIIIITLLSILSLVIRAIAWRTILGDQVSLKTAFFGVSEGYFLNNLFPFRAGEIGKSLFVGRSSGLGTFYVLSTVLIERAFDIFFAAGIVLITIPLIIGADWIKPIAFTAFVVIILGFIGLFLIANNRSKVQDWIQKRTFRSKFINNWILPQVNKIMGGLTALSKPAQFFKSVFWIALTWVVWMVIYYITITQLSENAPLWWGAFVSGLLALGVAVPSAPAALGVFEAALVGAFALLGISSSAALAYAIVLHIDQIIVSAVFGLWGLIRDGQNLSTIMSSLTAKKQVESKEG